MKTFEQLEAAIQSAMNTGYIPEGSSEEAFGEIAQLMDLRQKALAGQMVGDEPAAKVLENKYFSKTRLAHIGMFPLVKEGYFSLDDWRQIYLPYCRQLVTQVESRWEQKLDPIKYASYEELRDLCQRLFIDLSLIPISGDQLRKWHAMSFAYNLVQNLD